MSDEPPNADEEVPDQRVEMNFRIADFPSDALSVKHFRKHFPKHFDDSDIIADGYVCNDFFYPSGYDEPAHLMALTELICAERTVSSGAFYRRYQERDGQYLNEEDEECIAEDKQRLERHYQFFGLAEGPETARLLIRQVEEQGEQQAHQLRGRQR